MDEQVARVLVTGGSGFIGHALVGALMDSGAEVLNLDIAPGPGEWVLGDVRSMPPDLPPARSVIHVAGLAGGGGPADRDLRAVNVDGTAAVLAHARSSGIRRVIVLSSIAVLGPTELPLDEDAPHRPVTAYGRSKAAAEELAFAAAADGELEVVVVRPGYVFGPDHRGNFGRMLSAIERGRFLLPGREDTLKAGIYRPDLVRLLQWLESVPDPPPLVNAVYPDTPTLLALTRVIRERLGQSGGASVVPAPLARAGLAIARALGSRRLAGLQEEISKLRESSNVISRVIPSPDYPLFDYRYTRSEALGDLLAQVQTR